MTDNDALYRQIDDFDSMLARAILELEGLARQVDDHLREYDDCTDAR